MNADKDYIMDVKSMMFHVKQMIILHYLIPCGSGMSVKYKKHSQATRVLLFHCKNGAEIWKF